MKRIADFNANERMVIRERHYGHEEASYALLASVFQTSPQTIRSICNGTRATVTQSAVDLLEDPETSVQQHRGPDAQQ